MEELKKCPFCGGKADCKEVKGFDKETVSASVICKQCGASTRSYVSKAAATEAWNTRKVNEKMNIEGYVTEAKTVNKRITYVYPVEHHYEDVGEKSYIKYGCPVCEYLGNHHSFAYGVYNCSLCGVNLKWKVKGIVIGRHIDGITLNPLEYLLDEDGEKMVFASEEEAKEYLIGKGITEEEMYWIVFEEVLL